MNTKFAFLLFLQPLAGFVEAIQYFTIAEIKPTKEEFPTAPPENLVAGSSVFVPMLQKVKLDDYFQGELAL